MPCLAHTGFSRSCAACSNCLMCTHLAYISLVKHVLQKTRQNRSNQHLIHVLLQAKTPTAVTVILYANKSLCFSKRAAANAEMCLLEVKLKVYTHLILSGIMRVSPGSQVSSCALIGYLATWPLLPFHRRVINQLLIRCLLPLQ